MAAPDFSRFGTLVDAAPDFLKFGTPVNEPGKSDFATQPGKRSPGNARPWSEVASSPAFNALSPSEQEAARGQYFDQAVAPRVVENERAAARAQFDNATRQAVTGAAIPTKKRPLEEAGAFRLDEHADTSPVDDALDFSKRTVDNAWGFAKDAVLSTFGLESAKSESAGADYGRALGKGLTVDVAETLQGANEMAKQTPLGLFTDLVTPTFLKQVRDSANDAVMAAIQRRGKTLSTGMTDESQASANKNFFTKEASWAHLSKDGIANVPARIAELVSQGKFFDEGWSDPHKVGLSAIESVPVSVVSMIPVIRASATAHELALTRALAGGASESEAKSIALAAAKNTASKAGALSEGATGAGQQWSQTYHQVLDLPQAKLDASPEYQDALDAMPKDWAPARRAIEARKAVAKASANTAAVVAGVADALFAGMGDRYIGGAVAGKGGRVRSAALGVAEETPTETAQSGAEQFGTNLGIRQHADPSQQLMDQVGEQAVGGGLSGGLMGAGFGGAAHTRSASLPGTRNEALPASDALGTPDSTAAPSAPTPTPTPTPAPDAGGIESMLADPKVLFEAVTARPAIFGTIEDALKEMPEVKAAPPEKVATLADALKEMEADPKAIFAIATSQPELYQTIAKAAAQTEKLANEPTITLPKPANRSDTTIAPEPGTSAQVIAQTTQSPSAPAPDFAAQTDAAYAERAAAEARQRTQEEQAARDQQMRDTYQQELARAEAANSGLRPEDQVPKTALQLELERLGLTPDKFRKKEAAPATTAQALQRRTIDATDEALVSRLVAHSGDGIRLAAPSEVPVSADARAGVQIASSFGKRVVFVHSAQRFAGLVLPEDPNTIYVNARSPHLAPLAIIGHELLHTLRRTNEAIYRPLLARVMPLMKDVPEYRAWMKEALTAEGQQITDAELDDLTHEELIGDFLGDHFMQPAFWTEVFRGQERSWVEKVRDSIARALATLRIRLQIGGKRGFGSEHYIKDVNAVRRAMAEAFNAWQRESKSKPEARRSPRVAESQARSPSGQREAGVTPGRGAALPGQPAMASREAESKPAELATLVRTKKEPRAGLKALQTRLRKGSRGVNIETAQPAGKALDIRNQSLIDWEKKHGPYPQGRAKRIGGNGSPWVAADANGVPIKTSPQFDDMGAAARWSQYIQIAERLTQHSKTKGAKVVLELADAFAKKIIAKGQARVVAAVPDQLAHEAATSSKNALSEPTPAQVEAGNYRKGHMHIGGLDISIENPEGSKRRPEWPVLHAHYGYIRLTEGRDGDHVDVFVKPGTPADFAGPVYVIDQKKSSGHFDEHKVMLGWTSMPSAKVGYEENFTKGWDGVKDITLFRTMDAFKQWLEYGDTTKPVAPQILYAREGGKSAKQPPKLDAFYANLSTTLAIAKKVDATTEQKRAIVDGARKVLTVAPWLRNAFLSVSSWKASTDGTSYGTFDNESRELQINEDLLDKDAKYLLEQLAEDQTGKDLLVGTMAHEVGHAFDFNSGLVAVSMLHDDFRTTGSSTKPIAVGHVIAEAVGLWENRENITNRAVYDYLSYPFEYWGSGTKDRGFFRRELFAQLVAMYTTSRELMKEHLPHGYALIDGLANGEEWNAIGHGQDLEEYGANPDHNQGARPSGQRVSSEARRNSNLVGAATENAGAENRAAPQSSRHEHASETGQPRPGERGRAGGVTLYSRQRDPGSGQVAGGRGALETLRAAALGAARGAVKASRPITFALDAANRGIETVVRLPAKLLVAPVTSRLYDRVVGIGRSLAQKSPIAQEIAHGLVADYGLPEPYLDARQDRESRIQAVLRNSKHLIDQIAGLTRAEARVAYLWMQEAPSSAIEAQLLAQLPESSRQTLADMKAQIDTFGQEAVRLGLLSRDSYDRNHQAYLHRTYKKHELENPKAASTGQKAKSIRADAYRGRGLKDDVAASRLPGVTQGARSNRMELRDPGNAGQLGKLRRVVYLPAGLPIPQTYTGWRNDGVWEARWMPSKAGDPVGMWRDMSAEERARLGEIDEVRYAFARTMLATTRDIETARFLDWVRKTYAKPSEEAVAEAGQRVSSAVDTAITAKTYASDEWVQVPQSFVQGLKVKKYGALAGQYLPGHVWNDIRSTMNFRSESAAWRLYDELLRAWKISRTGLSPVVHTNNVMSNFILADMADVRHEHIRQSLRTIIDAKRGDEAARAIMERFYASGAESGSQSLIELRTEIIEPMLAELAREEGETLATVSLLQAVSLAAHGNLRQALAALAAKRATKLTTWPFKAMIDAYRSEDSVFRLAKFMKETSEGKTDREAGKEARVAFLDYNINAPWIQAMRRGPLPFISFSYRAIPLLIQAATKRPEKMMKYFAVGYAMNALTYAFLGAAGDEDRERRLMPDEKSGWALGIFYRMLRMPWNDEHGSPVFLDVRRWIPGGDIMDLTGSKSAIPLPQWLSVGGPLSLFIELAANKNLFTGKPIVKESDTPGEQTTKLMDHLFKFIMPNLPIWNPAGTIADAALQERGLFQTYSWKSIQAALGGETDAAGRPRDLGRAILSSAGVKLTSQPEDLAKKNLRGERDAQLREVSEALSAYRRQAQTGGLTTEELRQRVERQNAKKHDITQRYSERAGLRRIE